MNLSPVQVKGPPRLGALEVLSRVRSMAAAGAAEVGDTDAETNGQVAGILARRSNARSLFFSSSTTLPEM